MKISGYFKQYIFYFLFFLFYQIPIFTYAELSNTPFTIGEMIRYSVHIAGIKVGTQTIKLVSEETFNGIAVFRIRGITETTGISNLLHKYSERWTVLIDTSTLYPIWIERHIEDRGIPITYTYFIDQAQKKILISNGNGEEKKIIYTDNVVFDRFSLCYFYRKNPSLFKNNVSFDFLRKESVSTIHLREVGLVQVSIPSLSGKDSITTSKFMEEGGDGIEIYSGTDGFNIPLKIVFRSPLAKKKKSAVIELYIRDYAIDNDRYSLPKQYRRLLNKNLFTMNM